MQYYQQFPQQNMMHQPPQPLICYQTENGELMPLTPAVQPICKYFNICKLKFRTLLIVLSFDSTDYGYPAAPQTPVYYQPPHTQFLDGTVNSTDSGIVDYSAFAYQQQHAYPIIYQPPTPIYYPQTPMIPAQHVATPQMAPVYPLAYNGTPMQQQQQVANMHQDTVSQQTNESISTGPNETSNTNSNNNANNSPN
jgi:hypothetical protein